VGPATGQGRPPDGRPDLRVEGQDRIFAIGDIALTGEHPVPQLAQPALQMGRHAAVQIRRLEAGQDTVPFRYHDKGIMATIGSRSAVVELNHGIRFPRHHRLAGLAGAAPGHAAGRPEPDQRADQLLVPLPELCGAAAASSSATTRPPRTPRATNAAGRRGGRGRTRRRGRGSAGHDARDPQHVGLIPGELLEQAGQRVQAGIGREHHRGRVTLPGLLGPPPGPAPPLPPARHGSPGPGPEQVSPPAPGRPGARRLPRPGAARWSLGA